MTGEPQILCRSNKRSNLDQHKNFIIRCLTEEKTKAETARQVLALGCGCKEENVRHYVHSVVKQYQINVNKYISSSQKRFQNKSKTADYVTRKGIFQYLWLNGDLALEQVEFLWNKYRVLQEVEKCIREFREIFRTKRMPFLYLFIERYKQSSIKELASFAKGLEKDIAAVENAVASDLSNGFVEGTNSKLKMIKRTMYGRCSQKLLEGITRKEKILHAIASGNTSTINFCDCVACPFFIIIFSFTIVPLYYIGGYVKLSIMIQ